jgi:hypothetical protein
MTGIMMKRTMARVRVRVVRMADSSPDGPGDVYTTVLF